MGIVIKSTALSVDGSIGSSIAHAAMAAKECIRAAGIRTDEIDVLINVGIYRDGNLMEPAIAALIQKEIGLGLDYIKYPAAKAALSFDLMNGACGLLNAVQAAGGLLGSGMEYALVVSGDTHPSMKATPGFPYATIGAAMLLARSERDAAGFGPLSVAASDDDFVGIEGKVTCGIDDPTGRDRIEIVRHPAYAPRLLELMLRTARLYVTTEGINLDRTLLVTSQLTPTFGAEIAAGLDMNPASVAPLGKASAGADPHTSALTIAWHDAVLRGLDKMYDQTLFIAGGAGLSTACTVYRH